MIKGERSQNMGREMNANWHSTNKVNVCQ
jgi:hypothetical protein